MLGPERYWLREANKVKKRFELPIRYARQAKDHDRVRKLREQMYDDTLEYLDYYRTAPTDNLIRRAAELDLMK